jgi:predicted permease
MTRFFRRLIALFTHGRDETEVAREIAAHLTLLEDEHRRRGMTADEARLAARRAMGSVALAKDRRRDARSFGWLEDLGRDMRLALRGLRRTPGFAAIAIGTLALGIGANTTMFSVVHAVLLRPASRDAELVRLFAHLPPAASPTRQPLRTAGGITEAEMAELRARSRTLSHVGTMGMSLVTLTGHDTASRLQAIRVSASVLPMLDARPLFGRVIEPSDEAPGAEQVVVLSHGAWMRHFGGDRAVVGRQVRFAAALGPRSEWNATIVGVMPLGFEFPDEQAAMWMTHEALPPARLAVWRRTMLARLRDSVTIDAATAEVAGILRGLRPDEDPGIRYELAAQADARVTEIKPALLVLTVAVAFVLLIACINVANLFLARGFAHQREMAIRVAIGAGRFRLLRHVLTESAVIAVAGGAAGIALAVAGIRVLRSLASTLGRIDLGLDLAFPRLEQVGIDPTVLAFTLAVSMLTALAFGIVPALRDSRSDAAALNDGARTAIGIDAGRRGGLGSLLVAAEIGLALVLLVGAGLLTRGFIELSSVHPGFNPRQLLTFQVALPLDRYPDDARIVAFSEALVERLSASAGVAGAAYARQLPMVQLEDAMQIRRTAVPPDRRGSDVRFVSRDYIDVMGIRVIAGQSVDDRRDQLRGVLINEALAARDFAGEDPLGQTLYIGRDSAPWQIVGIVGNVKQLGLDREPLPQFFADISQFREPGFPLFPLGPYFAARTTNEPEALTPMVGRIVREMDPLATLFNIAPMTDLVADRLGRRRLYSALLSAFAAGGLMLAVIGVYGVMAYTVTRRTREIGIRVALGATSSTVMALVLRRAFLITSIGMAAGLAGSAVVTRYLEGMLFGVRPLDPATFVGAAAVFAVVALVAAIVPARRALRISPSLALRAE